jgi:hypothetical protein
MSAWIIVKRRGQEVEIVHWGELPEAQPIKLGANGSCEHRWGAGLGDAFQTGRTEPRASGTGIRLFQNCSRCGMVRQVSS